MNCYEEDTGGDAMISKKDEVPEAFESSSSSVGSTGQEEDGSSSSLSVSYLRDDSDDDADDDDNDFYKQFKEAGLFSLEEPHACEMEASRHFRTVFETEKSVRALRSSEISSRSLARNCFTESPKQEERKQRVVRFATLSGRLQQTVHRYEQEATGEELWFTRDEIDEIHKHAKTFADLYQETNPKFIAAVLGLSFSFKGNVTKKQRKKFKQVLEECCDDARGLEAAIVKITKTFREAHIDMVLQSQTSQRQDGIALEEEGLEALRKASRKTSQPSRQLARKLGEHDTFEGMKATLSPWETA